MKLKKLKLGPAMGNDVFVRFHRSVNMSPNEIRAWAKNPKAREASFEATRRRLPALASLKNKPRRQWTARDMAFARRVLSFNARMEGMVRKWGCTRKAVISLRNWGRQPPKCPAPPRKK
jgi:hypothetical protein